MTSVWWGYAIYQHFTVPVPTKGGQYVEAVTGQPRFINPLLSRGSSEADKLLTQLVYNSLFSYDSNGDLKPDLAERFERSDDGKEYTVYLRQDITWHDGERFDAEDASYTINIAKDIKYGAAGVLSAIRLAWVNVDVEKIDDFTLKFKLEKPRGDFLHLLTLGILPEHVWGAVTPDQFQLAEHNTKPIGTGPYEFVSRDLNENQIVTAYTLRANESFHKGEPLITKTVFQFYADRESAVQAYIDGLVSGVTADKREHIDALANLSDAQKVIPSPAYYAIFFNQTKSKPLAFDEVREALTLATNRESLIDGVFGISAYPAYSVLLPDMQGYDESAVQPVYDLEKAKQLLEEKGWKVQEDGIRKKDGDDARLAFTLFVRDGQEQLAKSAELLAGQWRELGVEVNIEKREGEDLRSNVINPRSYEALLTRHPMRWDQPQLLPYWHSKEKSDPGRNFAGMQDSEMDGALEALQVEHDEEKRKQLYQQVQKRILAEDPAVFLFTPGFVFAYTDELKGVTTNRVNVSQDRFAGIHEWYIKEGRSRK